MHIQSNINKSNKQSGFALIEVIIAILIITVGLFGVSAMLIQSIRSNHDSNIRTQALFLATDMAERIRNNQLLNPTQVMHYAGITGNEANPACNDSATGCTTPQDIRAFDGFSWGQMIRDTLPNGSGQVALGNTPNMLAISINWLEQNDSDTTSLDGIVQRTLVIEVLPNMLVPTALPVAPAGPAAGGP